MSCASLFQYTEERDHMLRVYFICSLILYLSITLIQLLTFNM